MALILVEFTTTHSGRTIAINPLQVVNIECEYDGTAIIVSILDYHQGMHVSETYEYVRDTIDNALYAIHKGVLN